MSKTYYEVLGVPRNASELEIKASYHRLARKYHPDKVAGQPDAEAKQAEFSSISMAYNILKDPEKRAAYDQSLEVKRQQEASKSGPMPKAGGNSSTPPANAGGGSGMPNNSANIDKTRAVVAKRAYIKGVQLMQSGDFPKAAEFLEVAIKNNDQEPVYHAKLAQTLLRSHRSFSRATDAAQNAINLDPYNSDYRLILAELYENAGSKSMAVRSYEEILKWDPMNERAKFALSILAPAKSSFLSKIFGKKKS